MNPSEDLPEEVRDRAYRPAGLEADRRDRGGPAVNLVVAFVLFWIFFVAIGPQETTTRVATVEKNMPAAGAIHPGDKLIAVDGVRASRRDSKQIRTTTAREADRRLQGVRPPRCCSTATAARSRSS